MQRNILLRLNKIENEGLMGIKLRARWFALTARLK